MFRSLIITFCLSLSLKSMYSQDLYKFTLETFRKEVVFNQKINADSFKSEVLDAAIYYVTNEIRKEHKLSFLPYCPELEASATIHSGDMAKGNFFDHINSKNKKHRDPEDRAKVAGVLNPHIAENIVEGFILRYVSNQNVMTGDKGVFLDPETNKELSVNTYLSLADELLRIWMNSPGHRANILSKDAVQLGCGTALFYMHDFNEMPCVKATQNFQWFEPVKNKANSKD